MSKVAVVFWSDTGNTLQMAEAVKAGAEEKGAQAELITAAGFNSSMASEFDGIAFGCPSMGAEQLEEYEFEPMWNDVKGNLSTKKIALFGSYGWGDGEWMRNWDSECKALNLNLACDYVICNESPDGAGIDECKALGAALA